MRATTTLAALLISALGLVSSGCETTFGEPCTLPKTEQFRRACSPVPAEDDGEANDGENAVVQESQASCAIKNFAGCETRICLVYRGSSSYCSEACTADSDCPGSAVCRPMLGDTDLEGNPCEPSDDGFPTECYCVRAGDADR